MDDPHVVIAEVDKESDFATIELTPDADPDKLPVVAAPTPTRRFRWGALLWSALGGLFTLAVGLAVSKLIEDLYARSLALGWFGVALATAAALALLVIVAREVRGLMKLSAIEQIRNKAIAAIASDKRAEGVAVAQDLLHLTRNAPAR